MNPALERASIRQLLLAVATALVLVAVTIAYAPVNRASEFIWDDHVLAEGDAPYRSVPLGKLLTEGFWPDTALGDHRAPYYRPLVLLSFRFDVALGGAPDDFHFTNLFLHLVGCGLVVFVALRLGARGGAAVLAALIWGVAPRLTESVAWISGRTDVIAGLLGLAALAISPDVVEDAPAPRRLVVWIRSIAAGSCLFGALLAKEVAIAFAAALAVATAERFAARRERVDLVRAALYIVGPLATWAALRGIAVAGRRGPELELGTGKRLVTVLEAIGRYAEMLVDAARPRTSIGMLGEPDMVRALVGGGIIVAFLLIIRHRRAVPTGVRIALPLVVFGLAPVVHAVPLALAGAVAADRLLYVPSLGVVLALSILARRLRPFWSTFAGAGTLVAAGIFMIATKERAKDYTDELRFWVAAVERAHPHNAVPRNALALAVQDAGDVELACRLYERSHQVLAASPQAWLPTHKRTVEGLVNCWARSGRYDDAVRLADDLSRRYPKSGRVLMGLGFARLHVRDFDGATAAFTRATELDPSLRRIVSPLLAELPQTRRIWQAFATGTRSPEARTDKLAWARNLADVGRAKEADVAYLSVALDDDLPTSARQPAIDYLVFTGSLAAAEQAVVHATSELHRHALLELVEARRAKRARVEALRQRIEAVAGDAS